MTTLALLKLNPRSRDARRSLGDPQHVHKTLMACMPSNGSKEARKDFGVLWRVEPGDAPTILMQSSVVPDFTRLPTDYAQVHSRSLDAHIDALGSSEVLHYRVVLNPVRKSRTGGNNRQSVVPSSERSDWAAERIVAAGMSLDGPPAITGMPARYITRASKRIPIYSIRADGVGQVTDAERLARALRIGLGPAKAWGCGFLTVVRP